MDFQIRKRLSHDRPGWVDERDAIFLTFCGQPRRLNQFATDHAWRNIVEEALHQERQGRWSPVLILSMPDHLHLVAVIPSHAGIRATGRLFKRGLATRLNCSWQKNFFDHRIRNPASFREKWAYILMNPRRAGLLPAGAVWPYVWTKDWDQG